MTGNPHPPAPSVGAQLRLLHRLTVDPAPALDELRASHGPVVQLGTGPFRMVVVGDAGAVRELFSEPNETYRWRHRFNVLGFIVGSTSMIVSDGAEHHRRRGAVQPALSRRRLNGWIPMMVERTDAAIDVAIGSARDGATVDMYEVGRRLVLDIVVRALFGQRMATRVDEIGALFERPQAYLESSALRQLPHPVPYTRRARVRADHRALDTLIDEELAAIRAAGDDDGDDHLLAALVRDGTLADREIRDQTTSLLGAGYHTTAAAIAWTLWEMMLDAGLWALMRDEADDAFAGEHDHTLLTALALSGRVMRESLRLHPPGLFSPREAMQDLDLAGHRIPRHTMVLWSAYLVGRDPDAWPDPLRFDPDRFLSANDGQRLAASTAWVPFGGGARNCVGFALAQMELTIILARIAQRLDLQPSATTVPRPVGMVVNRPEGGVRVGINAR